MLQDVPTILGGRYRVVERLGRGGMADVYRAEDLVLRRIVAIKVFRGGMEREPHLARFRAEVRTLARLTHPHLVALYDAGGDVEEPWCAMEYVNGGSLGDREEALPPAAMARIGEHVAAALAYVHGRGIVHRDVKPSNVLLDRDGGAFLSDFGIAKLVDGTRMTQSGLMIGTAAFLSPEQVRGQNAGPPADVYALGLVLLEGLTGRREYPGSPVESAVARLSRSPVVPAAFGEDWVTLLTDMTLERADDRPASAAVAARLARLSRVAAAVPAASAPVTPATPAIARITAVTPSAAGAPVRPIELVEPAAPLNPVPIAAVAAAGPARVPVGDEPDEPSGAADPSGAAGSAGPTGTGGPPRRRPRLAFGAMLPPGRRRTAVALLVGGGVAAALIGAVPLLDGGSTDRQIRIANGAPDSSGATTSPSSSADDRLLFHRAPVGELTTTSTSDAQVAARPASRDTVVHVAAAPAAAPPATTSKSPSTSPSASPSTSPSPTSKSPTPTPTPTTPNPTATVTPSSTPTTVPTSPGATLTSLPGTPSTSPTVTTPVGASPSVRTS